MDSDCGNKDGVKEKLICKAYQICIQELIPSIVPLSLDDVFIQVLLIIIMIMGIHIINQDSNARETTKND